MSFANLNIGKEEGYVWVTSFDDQSLKEFYNKFEELESNPNVGVIPVIISSYGGEVYSMIGMRDLIKSSKKAVMTIVIGKAMSCGAVLAASGTRGMRFISPESEFMIHEASTHVHGKTSDIKNEANSIDMLNEKMLGFLAKDSGNSVAKLKKHMNNKNNADWYLTAEEAVKIGFVDEIAIPRLFMEPSRIGIMIAKVDNKKAPKRGAKKSSKKSKKIVAKKKRKR